MHCSLLDTEEVLEEKERANNRWQGRFWGLFGIFQMKPWLSSVWVISWVFCLCIRWQRAQGIAGLIIFGWLEPFPRMDKQLQDLRCAIETLWTNWPCRLSQFLLCSLEISHLRPTHANGWSPWKWDWQSGGPVRRAYQEELLFQDPRFASQPYCLKTLGKLGSQLLANPRLESGVRWGDRGGS